MKNVEKEKALQTLNSFSDLDYIGWDGYSAEPISAYIVEKSKEVLNHFNYIPDVFPLSYNAVQFEWEDNKYYLELEVRADNTYHLYCTEGSNDLYDFDEDTFELVLEKINEVFAKMYMIS